MYFETIFAVVSCLGIVTFALIRKRRRLVLPSQFIELKASQSPESNEKIIVHLRSLAFDLAILSTKRLDLHKGSTLFLDLSPFCDSTNTDPVLLKSKVASASPLQSSRDSCLLRVLFKPQARQLVEQFRRSIELH